MAIDKRVADHVYDYR